MDNLAPLTPEEKPNVTALVLAAAVHLLLLGALFFGVQWKSQSPSSVAVEVWRGAPAPVAVNISNMEILPTLQVAAGLTTVKPA